MSTMTQAEHPERTGHGGESGRPARRARLVSGRFALALMSSLGTLTSFYLLLSVTPMHAVSAGAGRTIADPEALPRLGSWLRLGLYRWDDLDVSAQLEDDVVEAGCCHGTQSRLLGGCLGLVEHVERPVADCAALEVRVQESAAKVGAEDYRLDLRGPLLWSRQRPLSFGASGGRSPDAGGAHFPGAEEQVPVDFAESSACVRVKQPHRLGEELFLIVPGPGAVMCAVTQVGGFSYQVAAGSTTSANVQVLVIRKSMAVSRSATTECTKPLVKTIIPLGAERPLPGRCRGVALAAGGVSRPAGCRGIGQPGH